MTRLLFDDGDLSGLSDAWLGRPSFAWISRRSGVTEQWLQRRLELLPDAHRTDRFILLTSGSTGTPKLVIGDRARTLALADTLHSQQGLEPVTETVVILPLTYTYAFVNQWVWSQRKGRTLVSTAGMRDPQRLREALTETRSAMICLVGAQLPMLRGALASANFPGVIRVHFAGGAFPQQQLDYVRETFPNASIFNNYGCAEAMPRLTMRRADAADRPENVGPALPGVTLRTDPEGRVLFRSRYRCVGHIDDDGFAAYDDDQWLGTGDLGELDASGNLVLRGRSGEVFKRYGEKIALPGLLRSIQTVWSGQAALYREVDLAGEDGHVLVLEPHPDSAALRAIRMYLRATYGRAWWPLRIEGVNHIPLLDNGKVDVRATAALPDRVVCWRQRI